MTLFKDLSLREEVITGGVSDLSVLDTPEIDLTLTSSALYATLVPNSIVEGRLSSDVAFKLLQASNSLQPSDIGVTVQSYSSVLENTTASFTTVDETKLDNITSTVPVNLDDLQFELFSLTNALVYKGDWDASTGVFPSGGTAEVGWFYYVSTAGVVDGISFDVGDNLVSLVNNPSTTIFDDNWSKHDQTDLVQSVAGKVGSVILNSGDITDFQTAVSTNIDVSANTAARHNEVTLAGTSDYITIDANQVITRNQIDLSTDVTGVLPNGSLPNITEADIVDLGTSVVLNTNTIDVLTPSTSAQLNSVITDNTGSGSLVFSNSPTLTGTPLAPTQPLGDNSTAIATTEFVLANGGGGGFADPMTTRGDLIVRDATNTTARLGVGTAGQVLTSDGTDVSWAAPAANLAYTAAAGEGTVTSDVGTDATIPAATSVEAGLFLPAEKTKLTGIETNATADQTGAEIEALLDTQLGGTSWKTSTGDATSIQGTNVDSSVGTPSDGDILVYRSAGADFVLESKPASVSNPVTVFYQSVEILTYSDGGTTTMDNGAFNAFSLTANGTSTTAAHSNVPTTGNEYYFRLHLTWTSGAITWPSSWTKGMNAPTATGDYIIHGVTIDGGTSFAITLEYL